MTLLTHKPSCKGSVVLDVNHAVKMFAPSFSINPTGISTSVLDVEVDKGDFLPEFMCLKCTKSITSEEIAEEIFAQCQICGDRQPVKNIQVHTHIPTICNNCVEEIKGHLSGTRDASTNALEYISSFGLTLKMKLIPLHTVLTTRVKL